MPRAPETFAPPLEIASLECFRAVVVVIVVVVIVVVMFDVVMNEYAYLYSAS